MRIIRHKNQSFATTRTHQQDNLLCFDAMYAIDSARKKIAVLCEGTGVHPFADEISRAEDRLFQVICDLDDLQRSMNNLHKMQQNEDAN